MKIAPLSSSLFGYQHKKFNSQKNKSAQNTVSFGNRFPRGVEFTPEYIKEKRQRYARIETAYSTQIGSYMVHPGYYELYDDLLKLISSGREAYLDDYMRLVDFEGPYRDEKGNQSLAFNWGAGDRDNTVQNLKKYNLEDYEKHHEEGLEKSILYAREFRNAVVESIKNGTLDEFRAKYDEDIKAIDKIALEYGIDSSGSYVAFVPEEPVRAVDFDKKNEMINKKAQRLRDEALSCARVNTEIEKGRGFKRGAKAVFSLGVSELVRCCYYINKREDFLESANKEIAQDRKKLNDTLQAQLVKRKQQLDRIEGVADIMQKTEVIKEKARQELQEGLINKINDFYKNVPVKLPNCVMFISKNPYISKELAYWTGDVTDTNFVYIPYNPNRNELRRDLFNQLEQAEETYQDTGRRSIIYCENMEDLINPEKSSSSEIALMKDYMQCIDEDYHSTLIFRAPEPEKLSYETIQVHRVGLRIKIPITVEEADIYKKGKEGEE